MNQNPLHLARLRRGHTQAEASANIVDPTESSRGRLLRLELGQIKGTETEQARITAYIERSYGANDNHAQ